MRILITLFATFYYMSALAQDFRQKYERSFEALEPPQKIEWVDFDNDSLLDVLIVSGNFPGEQTIGIYKNDGERLSMSTSFHTQISRSVYFVADVDSDNMMDIILSGYENGLPATVVYFNKGGFVFDRLKIMDSSGTAIHFSDLNRDGKRELLLSGSNGSDPFVKIYRQEGERWKLVNDSIRLIASSVEVFDFENDGDNDLFLSGKNAAGQAITRAYYNQGNFHFMPSKDSSRWSGKSAIGDMNHDGFLDIILSGMDEDSQEHNVVYLNNQAFFAVKDTLAVKGILKLFAADLRNDGRSDISFFGLTGEGDTVNQILNHEGSFEFLSSDSLRDQAFGDADRDGDLDIIHLLVKGTFAKVRILENTSLPQNTAPRRPYDAIGAKIFDYVFVYWQRPEDDHTPKVSITYDLHIREADADLVNASFDQNHQQRLVVSHGNTGTSNFALIRSPATILFEFSIQAVDNELYSSKSGVCKGFGGAGAGCTEISNEEIRACRNETIHFPASDPHTAWFSFENGYLGTGISISYKVSKADTLFSVAPPGPTSACVVINVYIIQIPENVTRVEDYTKYVCEGAVVDFFASEEFSATWSSAKKGFLSNDHTIAFTVTEADTVQLELTNGSGCHILERTALVISRPELEIESEALQILKGEGARLYAQGNGETFTWTPSTGLENTEGRAVMAYPSKTTEYTVTAADSLGCTASKKIMVIVEQTAFVPNLFTPNDDGKNDALKIFGLNAPGLFTFSIYNREGSIVYSTTDISEAVNTGWNGMTNGVKQPVGVYYWKVKGQMQNGAKILLNGKTSGPVVLVR